MSKKIISFVQPNFPTAIMHDKEVHYLPYSVGCVWSYSAQFESIKSCWQLGEFVFRREPIEVVAERLSNCSIVGFSTYVWNKNYNYQLANLIREKNPNCLIVFGGPEVPVTRDTLFETIPAADIVVETEGEKAFKQILDAYGTSYDHIPGLLINLNGKVHKTSDPVRIDNLEELPSPYLTGVFDKLVKENPDVSWSASLETNRGCPYQCTFCDWGSLTYNKVKKFNLERVREEINWFGQNKIHNCYILDANFGMFFDRDSQVIDYAIDAKKQLGFPNVYYMTWAKNQQKEVVTLAQKMISAGLVPPGVNTSVQSLDPYVLDVIKRKNLDLSKIKELCDYCERYGIPINTELILGLPGETLKSWKNNYWQLFEIGNHHGINLFPAQALENAEMNLSQKGIFKLNTVYVRDYFKNRKEYDTVDEGMSIVISTSTLPVDDMRSAYCFSWYMYTTHLSGLTTLFARFLRKYFNESYENFYTKLYGHLKTDQWFVDEEHEIGKFYDNWRTTGFTDGPIIASLEMSGDTIVYKTRVKLLASNKTELFIDNVGKFIENNYNLDAELLSDLIVMQKNTTVNFHRHYLNQYPMNLSLKHDILGYLIDGTELKTPIDVVVTPLPRVPKNKEVFFQLFHYGRRSQFIFNTIEKIQK